MFAAPAPPPALPREAWSAHPNYPQQVLLLRSHQSFRRYMRGLVDQAREGRLVGLHHRFSMLRQAMGGHEAYEERKLYPFLERRFTTSMADAQAGHDALHAQAEVVESAFAAGASVRDPAEVDGAARERDEAALVEALERFREILDAHLDLEEERVIPMLLALPPEQFRAYYDGSIRALLASIRDPEPT